MWLLEVGFLRCVHITECVWNIYKIFYKVCAVLSHMKNVGNGIYGLHWLKTYKDKKCVTLRYSKYFRLDDEKSCFSVNVNSFCRCEDGIKYSQLDTEATKFFYVFRTLAIDFILFCVACYVGRKTISGLLMFIYDCVIIILFILITNSCWQIEVIFGCNM